MTDVIVALDLPNGRDALALASRLPDVQWVKLGPVLYVREGPALVREFAARGVQVFLDLKLHDIPTTVAGAVSAAADAGVAMATVHCLGGPAMLDAAARAAASPLAVVGVTLLTSHDAAQLEAILGRGVPDIGIEVERLARLALKAGLAGVVASGLELGLLREAFGTGPRIVVPGIRPNGDRADDQARTVTAQQAARGGATHIVVGRPVTQAKDPAGALARLREELA